MRQTILKVSVVAVLSVSAVAYGALQKHVTVNVDGEAVHLSTFATTVRDVLDRGEVALRPGDVVRPSLDSEVAEGAVIEIHRAKPITLILNGQPSQVIVTGLTVGEVVRELNLRGGLGDFVGPSRAERVTSGMTLTYREAVGVTVAHDGVTDQVITNAASVRDVIAELGVVMEPSDKVVPALDAYPAAGTAIAVLRVGIRLETVTEPIPFRTQTVRDSKLGRGQKQIRREGQAGLQQVQYNSTYEEGRLVARKALSVKVLRNPVSRVVAVGTSSRCSCSHGTQSGTGTWYRRNDGLTAAHPWLPFGTVVRVTNLENGRTVTVTIVDRGPYGKGRIIDLSDDAFGHLAPLSEGIIKVRIDW